MPDVSFQVEHAEVDRDAATPHLSFELAIFNADEAERIESIVLRTQIMIEATRRRYDAAEQARLADLFGEPERWSQTLGRLLWTHAITVVPAFTGSTTARLPVPCSFDFALAATKYFAGLDAGEIPLLVQFSGSVFYVADSALRVRADTLGPRVAISSAGDNLAANDGRALSEQRMATADPGPAGAAAAIQAAGRPGHVGPGPRSPARRAPVDRRAGRSTRLRHSRAPRSAGNLGKLVVRRRRSMNRDPVEAIADAVLYEGYILYPYRADAVKNRQRFNFGVLYPRSHCQCQLGPDTDQFQIECLAEGLTADARLQLRIRCLHLQNRQVEALAASARDCGVAPLESQFTPVSTLRVGDCLHQTWDEAVERQIVLEAIPLAQLAAKPCECDFEFPGGQNVEPLVDSDRRTRGRIVRRQEPIQGA